MAKVVEFVTGRLHVGKHALRRALADVIGIEITAGLLHGNHVIHDLFACVMEFGQISTL